MTTRTLTEPEINTHKQSDSTDSGIQSHLHDDLKQLIEQLALSATHFYTVNKKYILIFSIT